MALYHEVILIDANNDAYNKFIEVKPDIVFNIAEGINGVSRESQIPAILDLLNIPYTASDPLTLATCLNKARTKEILSYYNISNTKFSIVNKKEDLKDAALKYPLIVKPVSEGSSKGIFNSSLFTSYDQLNGDLDSRISSYKQSLIAEEYLPGREFTVAVMGNDDEAEVLPIVEINFEALPEEVHPIYSYEAKWILDGPDHQIEMYKCPADLTPELENKIKNIVLSAYRVLNCKDWARIDVRLDSAGEPNIIEVNPLPGILPDPKNNSCYPKAARVSGLTYSEMINNVLYFALKRYRMI